MKPGMPIVVVVAATVPFVLACLGGRFEEERAACDEFIACADAVDSSMTPTNEMAYGDDSPCWEGKEEAEICADACVQATLDLADATGEEACGGDGTPGDTDDTNDTNDTDRPGTLLIVNIVGECSPTSGTWTYAADTNGWTTGGLLSIDQDVTDAWQEEHDLPSVDYCDDGSCDYLEQVLAHVEDWRDQTVNESTLYDCTNDRIASMMWMIQIFDMDDNLADCVVWGADVSVFDTYACENANNW